MISNKEKERVEKLLPEVSNELQKIYHKTKEGNGQRWLMIDLTVNNDICQDVLKLIYIHKDSK